MLLLLARHGETIANAENRFQGQTDYPLSARGEKQSLALAEAVTAYPLEGIFTSDLTRARATGSAAAKKLGLPLSCQPLFREYGFGIVEGLTRPEVVRRYPYLGAEIAAGHHTAIPGAEQAACFQRRLAVTKAFFGRMSESACFLLVSHARFINGFLTFVLFSLKKNPGFFPVLPASLSGLILTEKKATLILYNDIRHLTGCL